MNTRAMYGALLSAQWKHQRLELGLLTIAAAIIAPVYLWPATSAELGQLPMKMLEASSTISLGGAWLSFIGGILLATRPFALDLRSRHTYVLSLPISRARYSLLRAAGGLTLTLLPTIGFLIGSLIAVQAAPLTVLHAYPVELTLRFLLASAMAFSIGFGLAYGIGRRTLRWTLITAVIIIGFELVGQLAFKGSTTAPVWEFFNQPASPIRVFTSRWMLFDV